MLDEILAILKKHDYLLIPVSSSLVAAIVVCYLYVKPMQETNALNYWVLVSIWIIYFLVLLIVFWFWTRLTEGKGNIDFKDKNDIKRNPGIYHIDNRERLNSYFKISLVENSSCIDMLGWNLNKTWFEIKEISEVFKLRMFNKNDVLKLRILLPTANSLAMNAFCNDRKALGEQTGTKNMGEQFLSRYLGTRNSLAHITGDRESEVVKLLQDEVIFSGILRFDKVMIVTNYLSGYRGSASPALILHQDARRTEARILFNKYLAEFDNLWNNRGKQLRLGVRI